MKTMMVANAKGERVFETKVYGIYGPLAVTKEVLKEGITAKPEYTITHIATGAATHYFERLADARIAARAWSVFDWAFTAPNDPKIIELGRQIKNTLEWRLSR